MSEFDTKINGVPALQSLVSHLRVSGTLILGEDKTVTLNDRSVSLGPLHIDQAQLTRAAAADKGKRTFEFIMNEISFKDVLELSQNVLKTVFGPNNQVCLLGQLSRKYTCRHVCVCVCVYIYVLNGLHIRVFAYITADS